MLEWLARHSDYCFLDSLSSYFEIPTAPKDQEKATVSYPYVIFAYCCMLFGLCYVPAMFQRCMMEIFEDIVEDIMEVFIITSQFLWHIRTVPQNLE